MQKIVNPVQTTISAAATLKAPAGQPSAGRFPVKRLPPSRPAVLRPAAGQPAIAQSPVRLVAPVSLVAALIITSSAVFFQIGELLILAGGLLGAAVALWTPQDGPPHVDPRPLPPAERVPVPRPCKKEPPARLERPSPVERPESRPRIEPKPRIESRPRVEPGKSPPAAEPAPRTDRDRRTVLVVDDQDGMLALVSAFLGNGGYRVLEASDGREALDICRRRQDEIDPLLIDVRMPVMDGPELQRQVAELYRGISVLFMSGLAPEWAAQQGVPEGADLIEKGFTPDELNRRVREIIDGSTGRAS